MKNTMQNNSSSKVAQLREKLRETFHGLDDQAYEIARQESEANAENMDEFTSAAFLRAWQATLDALNAVLRGDDEAPQFTENYYADLSSALLWKSYVVYDGWRCERCSDEELLAAANYIENENVEKLDSLRDRPTKGFRCGLSADSRNQYNLLCNLRYLCFSLAHFAKQCDAHEVGIMFLKLTSRMSRMKYGNNMVLTTESEVEEVLDMLRQALDELCAVVDYRNLAGWDDFRVKALNDIEAKKRAEGERKS